MVMFMDDDSIGNLTAKDIGDIATANSDEKYERLQGYYTGKHAILSENKKSSAVPNNKIVINRAKYITDTATGYFIGQPVIYNSENKAFLEAVSDIFVYNDEQDHNADLAKRCSIDGSCYEMLYMDAESKVRFMKVPAASGIMICRTDDGHREPAAFIRKIAYKDKDGNDILKVEYWNSTHVTYFISKNGGNLEQVSTEEHFWNDVPFVEYTNNEECIGDFEGVITGIDAYNRVQSNTANYFQYNDDALLKISKMGDVTSDDIREMKEKGAVVLEDGGDVDWLLKTVNDTALENYKTRLVNDIHTISNVPYLCDESFGQNLSGIAIAYKLWGLEQMSVIKERKFKRGLQRRLELIANILNKTGGQYDYREISMNFRRNQPKNEVEIAETVTKLSGELSRETRLQMIPAVEDVEKEIARIEAEKAADREDFGAYEGLAKAFKKTEESGDDEA